MPFKSDKQRRWMYANEPAMAKRWSAEYKQEGGPLAPLGAQTGIPTGGNAAPAINQYLSGTTPAPAGGAGGISYTPGAIAEGQADRIQDIRMARRDDAARAEAASFGIPMEAINQYENEWQGDPNREHWVGSHFSGPEHSKPIYSSFADWWNDAKQMGNGRFAAERNVYANNPANVNARNNATGLGDAMGTMALVNAALGGSNPESSSGSGSSWSPGTAWGDVKTNSGKTVSSNPDTSYEVRDSYSSGQFWNRGGMIPEDPWASQGVARTNVQTAPLGSASVATPAGKAPQGRGVREQLMGLAGKTLANNYLGGGFLGQAAGIVGGFNKGGSVGSTGKKVDSYLEWLKKNRDVEEALAKGRGQGPLSSVTYKMKGGEVEHHYERKYHNPLKDTGGTKDGKE